MLCFRAKGRGKKRPSTFPEPPAKIPRLEGPGSSIPVIDVDSLDISFEGKSGEQNKTEQQQLQLPEEPVIENPAKPDFSALSDLGILSNLLLTFVLELWRRAIEYCKNAMEVVLQRLPLHYKAMYRLAHLYFTAPRDIEVRDLLECIIFKVVLFISLFFRFVGFGQGYVYNDGTF